jgi:hypothetical protein
MPTPSENQLPDPHSDFASRNNIESPGKNSFRSKALLWQFKNTTMEEACSTCSRYALRLIDKVTGKAYSADELLEEYLPSTPGYTIGDSAPVNATAGAFQVETMTVVAAAGCTSDGNLTIGAGGLWVGGSPYPILVPLTVATHTTAELIAEAIRAAYAANSPFAAAWSISRSGAVLTMTRLVATANDGTANFTIAGGLGVSAVSSSTNTTAGVAVVGASTLAPPYLRVAGGFLYIQEAGVWKKIALSDL